MVAICRLTRRSKQCCKPQLMALFSFNSVGNYFLKNMKPRINADCCLFQDSENRRALEGDSENFVYAGWVLFEVRLIVCSLNSLNLPERDSRITCTRSWYRKVDLALNLCSFFYNKDLPR